MNNNIISDDDDDGMTTTVAAAAAAAAPITKTIRPTSECMHTVPTHAFIHTHTLRHTHFEKANWIEFCEIVHEKKSVTNERKKNDRGIS